MAAPMSPSDDLAKLNHFPDEVNHRDLRSRTRETNRHRKQSQKYYGYRAVDPSWINQPYYHLDLSSHATNTARPISMWPVTMIETAVTAIALSEVNPRHLPTSRSSPTLASLAEILKLPPGQTLRVRTSKWTPRDTYEYREDGIWPLDRRHHRGKKIREKKAQKWSMADLGRKEKQRAARVRGAVAEDDGADGDSQRTHVEPSEHEERKDGGVAFADSMDRQNDEETAASVVRAERVMSLQDFEIVTAPGSEAGDSDEWEILSAWSC